MADIANFANHFRAYNWDAKHQLYGYPGDAYPQFSWIASLEQRFAWLRANCESQGTASIYLIREMIQWGGSQNGTLQKFEEGVGEVNLQQIMLEIISNLHNPDRAITTALSLPGMGLTYASKLLRFLDPERYGALDSRIRNALQEKAPGTLPRIYDSSQASMVGGYMAFLDHLQTIIDQLEKGTILRPPCGLPAGQRSSQWRAADVEMALFGWAGSSEG
ncbi:hypothetical protein ABT364_23270 [Massilia sp. SR12]